MVYALLIAMIMPVAMCQNAVNGAATVVDVKGAVSYRTKAGATESAFRGKQIPAGSTVITAVNATAKLSFTDGSVIDVQPSSQFRVDIPPTEEQPGVFSLMAGSLRAKFSKAINEKPKAIIRTKNSVMGVRGTEFQATYNPRNSVASVVTYEGQVAVVGADSAAMSNTGRLLRSYENALSDSARVAFVGAGQYSGVTPGVAPSIPVRISPAQLESLRQVSTSPSVGAGGSVANNTAAVSSPVPPGVDARLLAPEAPTALQVDLLGSAAGVSPAPAQPALAPAVAPPEGYVDRNTGRVAPPAGGFVDIQSGVYVPPPPGSSFDPVAQVFVPPPTVGSFNAQTGNYTPPPGTQLDPVRGLVAAGAPPAPPPPSSGATLANTPPPGDGVSPASGSANDAQSVIGAAPVNTALGNINSGAPASQLFAGVDPANFSGGMVAAPPPPGTELRTYMAPPPPTAANGGTVLTPPPATVVLTANPTSGTAGAAGAIVAPGGYYAVPPPPNGQYYAGFDGFQPQFPVYNPFLCPPYCNPAYQPGTYPGMPAPAGDTRVSFIINE